MKRVHSKKSSGHANSITPPGQITPIAGKPITIGKGFSAISFKHSQFNGAMDPFIMVDHYTMTSPTFGVHPHAGLSAVSLLFEDSQGPFHNRDSLGNDFDLMPGDLYWLNAGTGILHDESPRPGSRVHGLQIFVNMANSRRSKTPSSTLIRSSDIPVINDGNKRLRVLLGGYDGIHGGRVPHEDSTLIDATLAPGGDFRFTPQAGANTWIYTVSGTLSLRHASAQGLLTAGHAYAIKETQHPFILANPSQSDTQVILFSGQAINEPFVQGGPFAMGDASALTHVQARFNQGEFGTLV